MERLSPPEPHQDKTTRDHAAHNPVGPRMHCVKLLGQRLAARDFDRQVAEFQIRVAVLNGFIALGIPVTEAGDESARGKGNPDRQPMCATEPFCGTDATKD
jgi:hypothetical protein